MAEKDKDVQEIIREVSFNVIKELAPEETDMFDEISESYFSDPGVFQRKKTGDDPVGFGMEGITDMLSPAAMSVVTTVVTYIAAEAFGAAKGALTDELKAKIKSIFNKKQVKKEDVSLTAEQLRDIHSKAVSCGIANHLTEEKSIALANALIASMALRQ